MVAISKLIGSSYDSDTHFHASCRISNSLEVESKERDAKKSDFLPLEEVTVLQNAFINFRTARYFICFILSKHKHFLKCLLEMALQR